VAANQSHTLRVEFVGTRSNVVFNGKPLFAVDDGTFPETGMMGLWTKTDSVTAFSGFNYGEQREGTPLVTPRTNWSVIDA
jgi:hypothetical protein